MYRVLLATLLAIIAIQLAGCTGTLRLGSSIPVVENEQSTANV